MTIPIQKDIEALREALAKGPTPGPYYVGHMSEEYDTLDVHESKDGLVVCESIRQKDFKWFAACSPDRISRLLAHIAQQASQLEALENHGRGLASLASLAEVVSLDVVSENTKLHERIEALENAIVEVQRLIGPLAFNSSEILKPITEAWNVNARMLSQHKPSEGREG